MDKLIADLGQLFPQLNFRVGPNFAWSPEHDEIIYPTGANDHVDNWQLLHEAGHALLEHKSYTSDFNLLKLEIEAWKQAREIAGQLSITIDEEHIQDCLDTYRDWLHKRSVCPTCSTKCLQQNDALHYHCFNCHTVWKVSANRFCRAYRRTMTNVASPLRSR